MAEIATIARPYAEALFKCAGLDRAALAAELQSLADIAADAALQRFADNPKVAAAQVAELVVGASGVKPSSAARNLLDAVIENGRLSVLPEIAAQYHALVNASSGVSDAVIHSAFDIDAAQLGGVLTALEKRFARRLNASVVIEPALIGGIRVVVGDEVLDTSVKARLEQMRMALTA